MDYYNDNLVMFKLLNVFAWVLIGGLYAAMAVFTWDLIRSHRRKQESPRPYDWAQEDDLT